MASSIITKRKLVVVFTTLIMAFSSCNDQFLDRPPLDQISIDDYWKSANDLRLYVLQFYSTFPGHGVNTNAGMYIEDGNSDNLIRATPNTILNGERGLRTGRWTNEWRNIRAVNIFFDYYHNVEDQFDAYRHYVGEAHFFRAWYYFDMVKQYGDTPWYSTQLFPDSEEALMQPRRPRTQVVDSILADLDAAIEYLDSRSETGNNRLSKEAALAFKTRVALYEGSWQKYHAHSVFGTPDADPDKYFDACVDAAEELMNGGYTVGIYSTGKPESDYYELFGMANMSSVDEVILYRAYNFDIGEGNDVIWTTISSPVQTGVTWALVSSYLGKDGLPYNYADAARVAKGNAFLTKIAEEVDSRYHATIWTPGDLRIASSGATFDKPSIDLSGSNLNTTGFQVKKFSDPYSPGIGRGTGGTGETGYILFRYGEVLLNYAEAKYELDGVVAYDALNQLRDRVGMPAFAVHPQTGEESMDYGYPIDDALYEIRRERRVELALEGQWPEDYRRWAAHALFKGKRPKGYPFDQSEFPQYSAPTDDNGLIDYFQNSMPQGFAFREEQDYLTSIPRDELALNPNLVQNPGWEN